MHTQLFRTFYLLFAGLFAWLFSGAAAVTLVSAQTGAVGPLLSGYITCSLCALLGHRALGYLFEPADR